MNYLETRAALIKISPDFTELPEEWTTGLKLKMAGIPLAHATLAGAYLPGVDLSSVYLQRANLQEANLAGANLQGAIMGLADLQNADLTGAVLRFANLKGANLSGANLEKTNWGGAKFDGANLQDTRGIVVLHIAGFSAFIGPEKSQINCLFQDNQKWLAMGFDTAQKYGLSEAQYRQFQMAAREAIKLLGST